MKWWWWARLYFSISASRMHLFWPFFITLFCGANSVNQDQLVINVNWKQFENFVNKQEQEPKAPNLVVLVKCTSGGKDLFSSIYSEYHYSVMYFYWILYKISVSDSAEYLFLSLQSNKKMIPYLQERVPEMAEKIKKWFTNHPAMFLILKSDGQVIFLENFDRINYYLLLQWYEKQFRIPLLKNAKETAQYAEMAVNAMNVLLLFCCLAAFIFGVRYNEFKFSQLILVPLFIFPTGHIWSQIHGVDSNAPSAMMFGFQFSLQHNTQYISEGFVILVLYSIFSFSLYKQSQDLMARAKGAKRSKYQNQKAVLRCIGLVVSYFALNACYRVKLWNKNNSIIIDCASTLRNIISRGNYPPRNMIDVNWCWAPRPIIDCGPLQNLHPSAPLPIASEMILTTNLVINEVHTPR